LSYSAPDPTVAATVVNLFAEEYVRHNLELRQETRLQAEQELKAELESLEERVQLSEKELMAYAQANDIMNVEQGQVDPLRNALLH
jgi:uncharacterized protein involved in exopolysaccharide biosynthesis